MPLTAHGEQSALRSHRTPNTAASTAPLPASVTIMIRPSGGVGCESSRCDLGQVATNIFRKIRNKRLDRKTTSRADLPGGHRSNPADDVPLCTERWIYRRPAEAT